MCTVKEPLLLGGKVELQGITLGTCHDPALRRLNKRIYFLFRELPFLKSYLCHEKGSFETVENLGPRPLLFYANQSSIFMHIETFLAKIFILLFDTRKIKYQNYVTTAKKVNVPTTTRTT